MLTTLRAEDQIHTYAIFKKTYSGLVGVAIESKQIPKMCIDIPYAD